MNNEFLYLFISFDLVNSTEYKSKYPNEWPEIFSKFYSIVEQECKDKFDNADVNIWKYIGDEILFYIFINDKEVLYNSLSYIDEILSISIKKINEYNKNTYTNKHYEYNKNIRLNTNDVELSIKSTVWIANLVDNSKDTKDCKNIIIYPKDTTSKDFLGNYIDTGFRISKFVTAGHIVISAELAYLLINMQKPYNSNLIIANLKIVGYEFLKGIWNGKAYPIIWYCNDWKNIRFNYDEHINSKIIENIKYGKVDDILEIESIPTQIRKNDEFNKLLILLDKIADEKPLEKTIHPLVELHIAAVDINKTNKKIFIAKRSEKKERLKNIWEFGCFQLSANKTFEEELKNGYKKEFNIELSYVDYDNPIGTFTVKDTSIQGIIFYAETECDDNCCQLINSKHTEYRWISKEEIDTIKDNEIVEKGKERIKKVFSIYSNRYKT